MSVYIPDMEMPENCDDCDLMTVEGKYGEPTCPFGRIIRCASERHPDCPLVPAPDIIQVDLGVFIEGKVKTFDIPNLKEIEHGDS